MNAIARLHADPALGPADKSVGTRVFISMDSLGECRLSKRAIAKLENISLPSVRQAIAKLCNAKWLVQVRVTDNVFTYRPGPRSQNESPDYPVGKIFTPHRVKNLPTPGEKTGVRRVEMPREQVERIIANLTELQRLYDAGSATEMAAVSEDQKRLWLIYSERIQDDIDDLVRHLSTYPVREED